MYKQRQEDTILCYFNIFLIILGKYTPQVARQRKRMMSRSCDMEMTLFLAISYHMLSQVVLTTFFVVVVIVFQEANLLLYFNVY